MRSRLSDATYALHLGPDLVRELPIIRLFGSDKEVASFVMLGDVELNIECARLLVEKFKAVGVIDAFDIIVGIEAKGITLAHETARLLGHPRFVVIRKTPKKYMVSALMVPSESITSAGLQTLVLDGLDIDRIRGKRVCLIEDVIATGGSVAAACELLQAAGAEVSVIATVLLKGDFEDPRLIFLSEPDM